MAPGESQRNPDNGNAFPQMRPPDRVLYNRLRPSSNFIFGSLIFVPCLAALVIVGMAGSGSHAWLLAPVLVLGGWLLSSVYWKREWPAQMQRDDARADEIVALADARLPMRRAAAFGWPIFLTLLCALFAVLTVLSGFDSRAVLIAAVLAIISAAAWIVAVRRSRSAGTLSVAGIEIGSTLIPWNAIASLRAHAIGRGGSAHLTISLFDRELARKIGTCAGVSSVGHSGTELSLPLDGSVEAVSVKYQFAHVLYSRARLQVARESGRRRAEEMRALLAAHPEEAAHVERRLRAEIEQDLARCRVTLDAFADRQAGLSLPSYPSTERARPLPVASQWILVGAIALVAALVIYGIKGSLIKSPEWGDLSPFVVLGIASVVSAWALAVLLPRADRDKRTMVALGIPMMILGMSWPLVMYALPDIFTRISGRDFTLVAEMQREYLPSDRSCRRRILGALFDSGGASRYYCAGYSEFDRLPDQGRMQVIGSQSWFGIHVDRVVAVRGEPQP